MLALIKDFNMSTDGYNEKKERDQQKSRRTYGDIKERLVSIRM